MKDYKTIFLNKMVKIKIPKENQQEITELESFTVTWKVKEGWGDHLLVYHKAFIDKNEAIEFKKQLEESAKFIKAWIRTEIYRN